MNQPDNINIKNEKGEFWSISDPIISIEDVGGHEKIKKDLIETIELSVEHEQIFSKYRVTPPRGFLLWGPPGCQRNKLIEGIANKTNAKLIKINVKFD